MGRGAGAVLCVGRAGRVVAVPPGWLHVYVRPPRGGGTAAARGFGPRANPERCAGMVCWFAGRAWVAVRPRAAKGREGKTEGRNVFEARGHGCP